MKVHKIMLVLLTIILLQSISASEFGVGIGDSSVSSGFGVDIIPPDTPTNYSIRNVNNSDYWDNLDIPNATQMENSNSQLNIKESWLTTFMTVLFDILFGAKDTDDLTEGTSNFYNNQTFDNRLRDVDCSGTDKVVGVYSNGTVKCGTVGAGFTPTNVAWTNESNTFTENQIIDGELNVTGDIYSNNYQVLSYQRTVNTKNVTMTAVM